MVPQGSPARSPEEAFHLAKEIDGDVVVKAQAWVTGRADLDAIQFVENPEEAASAASAILGMKINNFTVDTVMVEEKVTVKREFYGGVIIDDQAQAPVVIFSSVGGTGIEEIAQAHPSAVARFAVDIRRGLLDYQARDLVRRTGSQGNNFRLITIKVHVDRRFNWLKLKRVIF